ncbi:uncharacterized protein LOC131321177 [Rhododendron vialii]|uniref:uncharacterized protein LOC131321177 n=1 Tax=Rhododendron vialii TaxID=182163 RepID=UPI0026601853|nr:uncharacterized protein LOC131321177 [Rhododendron vialii]
MARNQPTVEVPVNVNVNPGQNGGLSNPVTEVPSSQVFDDPTFENVFTGVNRIPIGNQHYGQNQSFYQSIPTAIPIGSGVGNNGNNIPNVFNARIENQTLNPNINRNDNRNVPNMASVDPNMYGYDPPNRMRQDYPYGYDMRPEIHNQTRRIQEPYFRAQLMNIMQDMYGPGLRRIEKPMFKKSYPNWVDNVLFPRHYRIPDLVLFNGEENQSTVEHVGRFCLQIGEADLQEALKLKLFPHSLTRTAFSWFISLPPNSIHSWREMEEQFHSQFFRHAPEISVADLAKIKQRPSESVEQYMTRFKKVRNQCHFYIPKTEIVKIGQEGLEYDFKKHFTRTKFRNLFDFTSKAIGYEAILMGGEFRKRKSLGTYYQDLEGDVEIDVAQVIGKAPIVCDTLTKAEKPVNMPLLHPNRRNQANFRQYSFDLSKADQLFDELINQKIVTLSAGHIIPPEKDRKGKYYCKWHNSFRHNTNNCVTFRNCVQDLIQKGLL